MLHKEIPVRCIFYEKRVCCWCMNEREREGVCVCGWMGVCRCVGMCVRVRVVSLSLRVCVCVRACVRACVCE